MDSEANTVVDSVVDDVVDDVVDSVVDDVVDSVVDDVVDSVLTVLPYKQQRQRYVLIHLSCMKALHLKVTYRLLLHKALNSLYSIRIMVKLDLIFNIQLTDYISVA